MENCDDHQNKEIHRCAYKLNDNGLPLRPPTIHKYEWWEDKKRHSK